MMPEGAALCGYLEAPENDAGGDLIARQDVANIGNHTFPAL
jgi:hypothetical protein